MKVKFVPQNVEFEIKPGQSVMHVAQDNGLYIKSVCKGVPSCAECRVRVVENDHHVLPPGSEELALIGSGHFIDRRRLSCQLKCFGDITVDLTEQVNNQAELAAGKQPKSKLAVKDDRVEDTHVRTDGDYEDEIRRDDEARSELVEESHAATAAAGPEPRPAPMPPPAGQPHASSRPDRERQKRDQNREQKNDQRNDQRRDQRGGKGGRPGAEARGPKGGERGGEQRKPSAAQAGGAPGAQPRAAAEGAGAGGEEGAKRNRRRRRGGRGKGGGGQQAGAPGGSPPQQPRGGGGGGPRGNPNRGPSGQGPQG